MVTPTEAARQLLGQVAEHGFLSPLTIAASFNLQQRLIATLLERLGGEVHLPDLVAELASEMPGIELDEDEDGNYSLRLLP